MKFHGSTVLLHFLSHFDTDTGYVDEEYYYELEREDHPNSIDMTIITYVSRMETEDMHDRRFIVMIAVDTDEEFLPRQIEATTRARRVADIQREFLEKRAPLW